MKAVTELKFKVGEKVSMMLAGQIVFSGIITEAKKVKGEKPYTILAESGKNQYANEKYLTAYAGDVWCVFTKSWKTENGKPVSVRNILKDGLTQHEASLLCMELHKSTGELTFFNVSI